ncbi:transmembrane protein [Cystoisospora suis]|uniref:Transmembrane protein n=1 Tax=Cystoisospora suis TaxID=483139 RepID=A0A2C6KBW7_9APIC|nr:transmembrane protein [Cystoisospora suis]
MAKEPQEDLYIFNRGQYVERLKLLNEVAEKIFFYNKLLLVVDEQLNGVRLALGAYRRGELSSSPTKSAGAARVDITRDKALVTGDNAGILGIDDPGQRRDCVLIGTSFVYCDTGVSAEFFVQFVRKLEARREEYRSLRKAAVRELVALKPSVTELSDRECRLLLADPQFQLDEEDS